MIAKDMCISFPVVFGQVFRPPGVLTENFDHLYLWPGRHAPSLSASIIDVNVSRLSSKSSQPIIELR